MLQQMLKETGGHCHAKIRVGVWAPLSREAPNLIRVLSDVVFNANDGLPTGVGLPFGSDLSWEYPLGSSYGLEHCHGFSELYE
jgi:hypothetical protein